MCFGNETQTTKQTTNTPNPIIQNAAQSNLGFVQNLQQAGYTPYSGNRVADFSGLQDTGFNLAGANAATPDLANATNLIDQYSSAPASSVRAGTIAQNMSPYMNQYVAQALAPQIEGQNIQFAAQNVAQNSAATSSGAFGDARAGIEAANLTNQQDIARTGLLGQAYTNAFNTAIGAGAQDVSNNLTAQTTNANLQEQALARMLGGASALQNVVGSQEQLANATQQQGALQQAQAQAQLNVPYSDYLAAQQYPFLTSGLVNQTISASTPGLPGNQTQVTSAPDNSGYQILGSILGSTLKASDENVKEDMIEVGELKDGLPIYLFRYIDAPDLHVGLKAQDVEKVYPEAVVEHDGIKFVDYAKATAPSWMYGELAA